MVTRDSVRQVHMNCALPKAQNVGALSACIAKENVRNNGITGPCQTHAPVVGPLHAQEHRYSRPKHAISLSAAGSANWKNAGSRAIQILKDSKSRKNEQRGNGQTAALPKMRLGLPERALRSNNGLVSSGNNPNGAPPCIDPKNLASTRSQGSVSPASGRSSANISNLASIIHSPRPMVTSGLLPATCIVSSPRTNRRSASQAVQQKSIESPVALRSNRQTERNKVGETFGPDAAGRSNLQMKTKQAGNGNLRSDRQEREGPKPAKVKLAATARAIMVSKASGGFTFPNEQSTSRTTGSPRTPLRTGPLTYREVANGGSEGASSSTPRHHHRVPRTIDPTCKPSPSQSLLPRRPATALGHKVARGAKAGGGCGGAQANLGRVRQVDGERAKGTLVPKGKAPSKEGALEQYLKKKRQEQEQVEEPPLFMDGCRMMDLESVPNSLEDDNKIILDLPDP